MRTRAYPLAGLVTLTAAVAGCGSATPEPGELAAALPGDPELVSYIDLDAAREALGLPDDADPADYDELEAGDETPESELVAAAASGLPHVADSFSRTFEADATVLAIDHGQVSAAAAAQGSEGRVAVLQTDQPFDEVAESLEAAGFERDGELYAGESADPEPAFPYVADLGDGRVVVAAEAERAEAALADAEGEPGEAVALIDELESPERDAVTTPNQGCITAAAAGAEPGASEIEVVFTVDGEAQADLVPGELELAPGESATLSEPEVDADTVRLTLTPDEDLLRPGEVFATNAFLGGDIYACD